MRSKTNLVTVLVEDSVVVLEESISKSKVVKVGLLNSNGTVSLEA